MAELRDFDVTKLVQLAILAERQRFFFLFRPDFERVISHHIQHENYRGALEVLTKQVCFNVADVFGEIDIF